MDIPPQTNAASLRICLLGEFRLVVDSRTVDESQWKLRKAKSLVKLLALAPRHRLHREQLLELLWPDGNLSAAANNLHQTLYIARRILDPQGALGSRYLAWHEDFLTLCPNDQLWIDVEAFESAARDARRSQDTAIYHSALELYRGELLPDDRYADWAAARREAVHRQFLLLLTELANLYEHRQQYLPAIELLKRVLAAEPAHEEAHRSLMRQYALSGDRARALRQYQLLRDTLQTELDTEPDADSRRLYEQIVAGHYQQNEPKAFERRNNLPLSATSFVGRESEKAEVERLMKSTRLLTLTGPSGCGKTRLALEVAGELLDDFVDGVWLVELAALAEPAFVPQAVASALGLQDMTSRPLAELITNYLRPKQLVLILDNCEHLLDGCAQLATALLRECPALRLLATSRESLRVAGELSWKVPSLSLPDPRHLPVMQELLHSEAIRLFIERAQAAAPGFNLTERNAPPLARVCHRLDGVPLAIELAAARITALSIQQIAERLDDRFRLLTSGSRTALPRHQTLRGAIDWSYELLTERERVLLQRLSVFVGGWTLAAAESVCASEDGEAGGAALPLSTVFDIHARLVDKSLVVGEEQSDDLRYRMLESIRQYAGEKLSEAGEDRPLGLRHRDYYLRLAQAAEPNLRGADQAAWFRRLELERPNFRVAIECSRGSDESGKALQLVQALFWFWNAMGHHREGADLCRDVLRRPESLAPSVVRAKVLASTALFLWTQGNQIEAHDLATQALSISESLGDKSAIVLSLWTLGLINMGQDNFDSAGEHLRRCLAISRESGYLHHVGDTLHNLGILAIHTGDYEGARTYCEESVRIYRGLADRPFLAFALRWLAHVVAHEGDVDLALSLLKECMTLAQEWGGKRGVAAALAGLAANSALRGDLLRAARLFGAAEAILELMMSDLLPLERELVNQNIETLRSNLDTDVFKGAWAEGRLLTLEQAIRYALAGPIPGALTLEN